MAKRTDKDEVQQKAFLKINVAQGCDRVVIRIDADREIEIAFNSAEGEGEPSRCRVSCDGRQVAGHEARPGKMEFWEISLPKEQGSS